MPEVNGNIIFRKPDINALRDEGKTCVDMHFHTCYSDSKTRPADAVRLAKKMGIGVAVTDHNQIGGVLDAAENADGAMLIPGIEVSTSDGPHILAYFYSIGDLEKFWIDNIKDRIRDCQWIALRDMPTSKLLDILEKENCVTSAAHPMGYLGSNKGLEVCIRKRYIPKSEALRLDAYEVINSGISRKANVSAGRTSEMYGIGRTGGTDGHLLGELGGVVTVSDSDSAEDFLDSVAKKRVSVIGKEKGLHVKALMGLVSLTEFGRQAVSVGFVQFDQMVSNIIGHRRSRRNQS